MRLKMGERGGEEGRSSIFSWIPPSWSVVGQGNPAPAHGLVGSPPDGNNSLSSQTQ